jgi:hypothetical protein
LNAEYCSIRSDSAPELMKGVIHRICSYRNINLRVLNI